MMKFSETHVNFRRILGNLAHFRKFRNFRRSGQSAMIILLIHMFITTVSFNMPF